MLFRVLLLVAVLAVPAWAEAIAKINGPTAGKPGDLVVLNGRESVGSGFRWITPDGIQSIACGDGLELAFATGSQGAYTFILIAAAENAVIDYAKHTVTIGTAGPPDKPGQPDKPEPPDNDFAALAELSRSSAARLNDPTTALGLAQAIRGVDAQIEQACQRGTCPGLAATKQMMVAAIEQRLLARTGPSRGADWLDGWRRPVNAALTKINAADVPTYRTAMRAAATGLEESR